MVIPFLRQTYSNPLSKICAKGKNDKCLYTPSLL